MEHLYNKTIYGPKPRKSKWKRAKSLLTAKCEASHHSRSRILGGLKKLWAMKAPIVSLGALVGFLPIPLLMDGAEAKCAYVLFVMASMWLTEAVPIAVTALLPVFMFPLVGVLTATDVANSYLGNTSLLFIGGLIVAIGVEEANLHRRIALKVLKFVGSDPKWIMLGLMLPTWFLSMWISNTATASMMIPIVEAVLAQIRRARDDMDAESKASTAEISVDLTSSSTPSDILPNNPLSDAVHNTKINGLCGEVGCDSQGSEHNDVEGGDNQFEPLVDSEKQTRPTLRRLVSFKDDQSIDDAPLVYSGQGLDKNTYHLRENTSCVSRQSSVSRTSTEMSHESKDPEFKRLSKGLSLCIAYAGNVGGIATLTGTPPNLVLKGQADMFFAKYGADDAGSYNLTFVGWMVLAFPLSLLLLVLVWFWLVIYFLRGSCMKKNEQQMDAVKKVLSDELDKIGPVTFPEVMTSILFLFLILLWVTRDPRFVPGWAYFFKESYVSDATAACMVAVLFFILPKEKPNICCCHQKTAIYPDLPTYTPLLSWSTVQAKLPWGIIVLLGGGFALAKACKYSGLSFLVGEKLATFDSLEPWLFNFIICMVVAMATEVTSNTATATLLMPMMAELSLKLHVNPLYLMSSVALATSFAFMMPVATPPNAIVFSHGRLTIPDMVKAGAIVNVFAVAVLSLAVNTWGENFFGFSTMPDIFRNSTIV